MLTACRRRRAPQRTSDPADPEAVRRWYLIAAVAIAGCEQWKAPQRIGKLEDRVDELSSDVAELRGATGTPKARSKSKDEHAATGAEAGSGEAPHGEGSGEESAAKEPERSAGSGEGPVATNPPSPRPPRLRRTTSPRATTDRSPRTTPRVSPGTTPGARTTVR